MQLLLSFFISVIFASCSESSFENSAESGAIEEARPASVNSECQTSESYLKVKLLSSGLSRRPINEKISYIIEQKSCDTNDNISFNNETVFFDFDAVTEGSDLNYEIYSEPENSLLTSGVLRRIPGSDLFGNVGEIFGMYKTEQLSVDTDLIMIRMDILLNNSSINSQNPAATSIDTFFRVGSSAPHKELVPSIP